MGQIADHVVARLGPIYGTTLNVTELLKTWRAANNILNPAQEHAFYGAGDFNDKMHAFWSSTAATHVLLPGTNGSYITTPDHADFDIVGDIDLRVKVAMTDWTPLTTMGLISKYATNNLSWAFRMLLTTGRPQARWTPDGTTEIAVNGSAAPGVVDGSTKWMRMTIDVNDGSGNRVTKFSQSSDNITYVQFGTTTTTAGVTSLFSGTANVELGANTGGSFPLNGKIFAADVRNNILDNGTGIVAAPDFSGAFQGAGGYTDPQGHIWTLQGSASFA